jgi:O-antigen ligase
MRYILAVSLVEFIQRMVKNKSMLPLLIGLSVLGGVVSQSLMDLAATVISIFIIHNLYKKKVTIKSFKPIGIEWAFLGYFCIALIGLIINGKPPVPWFFYLSKFNWVFNLYVYIYAFNRVEPNYSQWMKYFSIAYLLPNIYAVITYFTRYDYLTKKEIVGGTIGIVDSATYHAHGNSLIFIFFVAIFVFSYERLTKNIKIISFLSLLLMGASIFLTFTRGIWGATFVSLLVLFLLRKKSWALYFAAGSLVTLTLLAYTFPPVHTRIVNSFTSHSDSLRLDLLKVHVEMFKTHPVVGIGYWESYRQIEDYWRYVGKRSGYFESHAHNQIVSVLATTGILGAIFYLAFSMFFVREAWLFYKSTKNDNRYHAISVACLLLLLQFFLACITDVTFEYAKIRGIFIIGLAVLISYKNRKKLNEY